jgi:hypothetical protein
VDHRGLAWDRVAAGWSWRIGEERGGAHACRSEAESKGATTNHRQATESQRRHGSSP